jgi:hypothetical protein
MLKSKKILSILFITTMVLGTIVGCGDNSNKETVTVTVDDDTKISTSIESEDYTIQEASADSIYDIQIVDADGNPILSGQYVSIDTYEYYKESMATDEDTISSTTINDIEYTFINQSETNIVLAKLSDEQAIMMYSFNGMETTQEILENIDWKIK